MEWPPIPRYYAPRQVAIIERARAHAEKVFESEREAEDYDPVVLLTQTFIDGYAAGWDDALERTNPRPE